MFRKKIAYSAVQGNPPPLHSLSCLSFIYCFADILLDQQFKHWSFYQNARMGLIKESDSQSLPGADPNLLQNININSLNIASTEQKAAAPSIEGEIDAMDIDKIS